MSITESVTNKRVTKLKKARVMHDFRNVWSHDFVLAINNRKKVNILHNEYLNSGHKGAVY